MDIYKERAACPLYTAISVIDGRWKPMIFQRLSERPLGFAELRRAMPRVTAKVLRQQLRQMLADDLIVHHNLSPRPPGIRYQISRHGRSLRPVFAILWRWGTSHLARAGADRGTLAVSPAGARSVRQSRGNDPP